MTNEDYIEAQKAHEEAVTKNVDIKELDELLVEAREFRYQMESRMHDIETMLGLEIDDLDEKLDYRAADLIEALKKEEDE